jgi:D-aminopeptidase
MGQNQTPAKETRKRVREYGIKVGILPTGQFDAITDVNDVLVGHTTIIKGTSDWSHAIVPHGGNLPKRFRARFCW